MKVQDAIDYFEGQENLAEALDMTSSAISMWKKRGGIVPIKSALRLSRITSDQLQLQMWDYFDERDYLDYIDE